jgi:hypothetical protein
VILPNSIANIISISELERRGLEISCSSGRLKLTNKQKTLEMTFQMNQAGLYAHVVTPTKLNLFQAVDENSQFFTPRQIEVAKLARNMNEIIDQALHSDFNAIIKNYLLPNMDVTSKILSMLNGFLVKSLEACKENS